MGKSTAVNEPYLPVFTDEEKTQLQKRRLERADRIALLKTKGGSSAALTKEVSKAPEESKEHLFHPIDFGSAERRVLWDKTKKQERAAQEKQANVDVAEGLIKALEASSGRGPRNIRVCQLIKRSASIVRRGQERDGHALLRNASR